MVRPRRSDATGRSTTTLKRGLAKRWIPDEGFVMHRRSMLESVAFRSLTLAARRTLDFLETEHMSHGGQENGNLAAPHRQIQAMGVSKRDVPRAFDMLKRFGFVVRTDGVMRLCGQMNMARYRLTYLSDREGSPPSDEWKLVTPADVAHFHANPRPVAD